MVEKSNPNDFIQTIQKSTFNGQHKTKQNFIYLWGKTGGKNNKPKKKKYMKNNKIYSNPYSFSCIYEFSISFCIAFGFF